MARRLKIAGLLAVALLAGVASAPFWVAPLIDWNSQRQRLAALLTEALGVGVEITGDIAVESLLPRARMSVGGIQAVTDAQDESATISVERVAATLEIWPLLDGVLDIESLHVEGIRATYRIDELGRHQWIGRSGPVPHGGASSSAPEAPDAGDPFIRDVRVGEFAVSDAALVYDDRITQQTLRVSDGSLRATLAALAQPLELSGEFDLNDRPVVLTAVLNSPDSLIRGAGAHLSASVKSTLLQANLDLEAALEPFLGANGSIEVEAPAVGQLAEWLDRPLGQMEDPGALRLSGRVSSTETQVTLHALALSSPDWDLTVSGGIVFDQAPTHLSLNIEGDRIDLDRYLPRRAAAPRRLQFGRPGTARSRDGLDDPIDLSVLQDFEGEMRIALEGLKVRNFEIGRTAFRAKLQDSLVDLELGELNLYGGRLLGQVTLDAAGAEPALDAKLAIDRVDLDSLREARRKKPLIGGEINGAVNVTSRGTTPRALLKTLNGTVLLELDPSQDLEPADSAVSKANVQLIIPESDETPYLLGRLSYAGESVTFDVETAPLPTIVADPGFALDVSVESGLGTLNYEGEVYRAPIFSLNGDLTADLPSAGDLAQWLGAPLPRDPGPVTLKASFESDGTEGNIKEAFIQGEDLNAEVNGSFDFSGEVSKFNLQAKTGVLRLDRYLPESTNGEDDAPADEADGQRTVVLLEDLSDEPLDLTAFRRLDGKVEIASEGVVLPGLVVGRLALGLQVTEGLADLAIEELAVNKSTLTGKVRVDGRQSAAVVDLSLKGSEIDLDTLLGRTAGEGELSLGSADIALEAQAKGASVRALATSVAPQVDLDLASVRLDARQSLEGLAIKLESGGLNSDIRLTATGALAAQDEPERALALDVTGDPVVKLLDNKTYATRGSASLDDVRIEVTAEVATPVTRPEPSLEVRSAGDSLAALDSVLDLRLPVLGPYDLTARMRAEGDTAELSDLDLTLGRSKASGRLSIDTGGERPSLAGDLTFESLDLTEYYGEEGFEDLMEDDAKAQASAAGDWVFDEAPLPFELLSEAEITEFTLAIANLKVDPDVVISDISSRLTLTDATLRLADLRGRIYDGDVSGRFEASQDGGANPEVELALKGENLDYGVFLQAFDITEGIRGRMKIDLALDGRGTSLRALVAGLDGRIDFNAEDGQFDREMLGLLAFGTGSILGPLLGKDDQGKLDCIVTTFIFEDGIGDTLVQYYETSSFSMAGDGVLDLKTETLDFVYSPRARETSLMRLATPFRVSGSMQSPDVSIDTGGTLLAAAKTAGTIASFINPLVGLGVLAGQAAIKDRNGCQTANQIQSGEISVEETEERTNRFLEQKDRN